MGSSQSRPSSSAAQPPRTGLQRRLSPLRRLSTLGRRQKERSRRDVIKPDEIQDESVNPTLVSESTPKETPLDPDQSPSVAISNEDRLPTAPVPLISYPVRRSVDRPIRPGSLVDRCQSTICPRHGIRHERRRSVRIPDWRPAAAVRRRRSFGAASDAIEINEVAIEQVASTPGASTSHSDIPTSSEAGPSTATTPIISDTAPSCTNIVSTPVTTPITAPDTTPTSPQSTSSIPITECSIPTTEANTLTSTNALRPGSMVASIHSSTTLQIHRTRSEPALGTPLIPLDTIPTPQRQLGRLRVEQGLLAEEVALLRRQLDLSRRELERAVVEAAAAENDLRNMEEEADTMPGAVLMIQGIAQTHLPVSSGNRLMRRWRGRDRDRERVRIPFEEQASTITGLILVASLATANTLLSTERPRPRPNTMLETLMRRIHPSRAFAVESLLANPAISAIGSRRRRESTDSETRAQADEIGDLNMPVEFTGWLASLQISIREAMREFVEGTTLPLSRTTSAQAIPPAVERPGTDRRISAPVLPTPTLNELILDSSIGDQVPQGSQYRRNDTNRGTVERLSPDAISPEVPQFHHQAGQTQSSQNRRGVTSDANGIRRLNFFRAHVFAAPEGSAEDAIVPCLFVGVRSTAQDPATFGQTGGHPFSDPPMPMPSSPNGGPEREVPEPISRTTTPHSPISDTDVSPPTVISPDETSEADELLPTIYRSRPGRVPMSSPNGGPEDQRQTRPTMSRTQALRSRLLALSPFSNQHRASTPNQTRPQSTTDTSLGAENQDSPTERQATFVMYVIGGNFPRNHPVLRIPGLLTGEPLSDEDMVLMGELLGEAKPPTATAEEVEKSGLKVVRGLEIRELVEKKEVLEGSADRCLVCLSDFEEDEECRILSCRHVFHRECVDQWIKVGRNACPACRTEAVERKPKTETTDSTDTATGGPAGSTSADQVRAADIPI